MRILIVNNCEDLEEDKFLRAFNHLRNFTDLEVSIFDNSDYCQYTKFEKVIKKSKLSVKSVVQLDAIPAQAESSEYTWGIKLEYSGIIDPFNDISLPRGIPKVTTVKMSTVPSKKRRSSVKEN